MLQPCKGLHTTDIHLIGLEIQGQSTKCSSILQPCKGLCTTELHIPRVYLLALVRPLAVALCASQL